MADHGRSNGSTGKTTQQAVHATGAAAQDEFEDVLPSIVKQEVAGRSVQEIMLAKCYRAFVRATPADREGRRQLFLQAREAYGLQHGGFAFETYKVHRVPDATPGNDRSNGEADTATGGAAGTGTKAPSVAGAILIQTKDDKMFIWLAGDFPGCSPVEELVMRLDRLSAEAYLLEDTDEKTAFLMRLVGVASFAVDLWATHAGKAELTDQERAELRERVAAEDKEIGRVEEFRAIADRQAKALYLRGVLAGLGAVALVGLIGSTLPTLQAQVPWVLAAGAAAGTLGGAVSVAMRTSRPSMRMDLKAGRGLVTVFGAFRPLLGGVFGGLLYVLVKGSLLPLQEPAAPDRVAAFFIGGAFLMGFNERLVRDLLVSAAGRITPAKDGDDPKGTDAS